MRRVLVILAFLAAPYTAMATATTHIWAPSADFQKPRVVRVTSDIYVPVEASASGAWNPPVTNAGLTLGLPPAGILHSELGFDHVAGFGSLDRDPFYFNGKAGVEEDALFRGAPAFAAGIYSAGTRPGATDINALYVKLAKSLGMPGRLSFGVYSGSEKLLLDSSGAPISSGYLVCLERPMVEISRNLWAALEYQSGKNALGAFSAGVSWAFSDKASVLFGYVKPNDPAYPATYTVQTDVDY